MTIEELKSEIHKAIDNLPDNRLPEVLQYFRSIALKYPDETKFAEMIDKIFKEHNELLKSLADS